MSRTTSRSTCPSRRHKRLGRPSRSRRRRRQQTPAEKKFVDEPEYKFADYQGRLDYDEDGFIRFDDGQGLLPRQRDPMTGRTGRCDPDTTVMYDTEPYMRRSGVLQQNPAKKYLFNCLAIHNDGKMIDDHARKTADDRPRHG